jgi:hypothetical protein
MARQDGASWGVTDAEIEKLCAYIKDDGAVGAYCGVSRERVAKIRAAMRPAEKRRYLSERSLPDSVTFGMDGDKMRNFAAENGSASLRNRILVAFHKFATRHRITEQEAQTLLLDTGLREQRKAA